MNALYFLSGALALLIALLFFGFILLIWGLRQLLIIGNQNDTIISLLQQVSVSLWNEGYMRTGLQEDREGSVPARDRKMELHHQIEDYRPSEPMFAKYR